MKTAEAKRKLQHELYLKMNKDEADRLIDKIESYVSQVRSEEREKKITGIRLHYDGQCAKVFIDLPDGEHEVIKDCGDEIDHWTNMRDRF